MASLTSAVVAGQTATAVQYNNLRNDALTAGHISLQTITGATKTVVVNE